METNDIPNTEVSDWVPMTNPVHLAVLGKAGEELGELISAKDRCIIQGLDGIDPDSGKVNLDWLTDEVADVEAMLLHIKQRFNLDRKAIQERRERKYFYKGAWFDKLQRDLDANSIDRAAGVNSAVDARTTVLDERTQKLINDRKNMWASPTPPPETLKVVEYITLLDCPPATIERMAALEPDLYIIPFYRSGEHVPVVKVYHGHVMPHRVLRFRTPLAWRQLPSVKEYVDSTLAMLRDSMSGEHTHVIFKEREALPIIEWSAPKPDEVTKPAEPHTKPVEFPDIQVLWKLEDKIIAFEYTNHRGELSERRMRMNSQHYGTTHFHPEPQWFMTGYDIVKQDWRVFAMKDMRNVRYTPPG